MSFFEQINDEEFHRAVLSICRVHEATKSLTFSHAHKCRHLFNSHRDWQIHMLLPIHHSQKSFVTLVPFISGGSYFPRRLWKTEKRSRTSKEICANADF